MHTLLRNFTKADAPEIERIQVESQEHLNVTVPANFFDDLKDIPSAFEGGAFLVAEVEGDIAGYGGLLKSGEIIRMRVSDRYRRQGLATEILAALVKRAAKLGMEKVHLHTLEEQVPAQRLYVANGFSAVTRAELYGNRVISYEKQLGS